MKNSLTVKDWELGTETSAILEVWLFKNDKNSWMVGKSLRLIYILHKDDAYQPTYLLQGCFFVILLD